MELLIEKMSYLSGVCLVFVNIFNSLSAILCVTDVLVLALCYVFFIEHLPRIRDLRSQNPEKQRVSEEENG
jgi:hypothetical protein